VTTAELIAFLKLRLGLVGSISDERVAGNELAFLTDARNEIRSRLALAAPMAVVDLVTLEQDVTVKERWKFPAATLDPLYLSRPREVTTRQPMNPANKLDYDHGLYIWETPRQLRVTTGWTPTGGLELDAVLMKPDLVNNGAIDLPTPCHRAIGLGAVKLVLMVNEDSDARSAEKIYEAEMDRLERIYSQLDEARGMELREALLESTGRALGETIY